MARPAADIVVVGAGPAGLTAALALAGAGVPVTLIDDNAGAGGQIFRGGTRDLPYPGKDARGNRLRSALLHAQDRIDWRPHSEVVGIEPDLSVWVHEGALGTVDRLRPKALLVATGALEVWAPVPGWTRPGVLGLGGLQGLLKTAGVVPDAPVVLAGAGPLLRLVAAQLLALDVPVTTVIDAAPLPTARQLLAMASQPALLAKGLGYEWALRRRDVTVLQRHVVTAIHGDAAGVRAVEVAPVDGDWRPLPHGRREFEAAVVGLGFGVRPNIELTRLADCAHDFDPARGGWHARRDADLQTSVPGLFVAGDGGGIGGVETALAEGALAAHTIALGLGLSAAASLLRGAADARNRIAGLQRFRAALADWSAPRPGIFEIADADTPVCRCEDVTRGQIAAAIAGGYAEVGPLKMNTRAGMGLCQGRSCTPAILHLAAALSGRTVEQVGLPTNRIPLRPVPLAAMAQLMR